MLSDTGNLRDLLNKIKNVRVAVIGDACLDVYWWADMQKSQLSRETPHHNLPVVRESMAPGAAGNVAVNAAALGCAAVYLVSPAGFDWRAAALEESLRQNGVITDGIVRSSQMITPAYIKPVRMGLSGIHAEDPRIDFAPDGPVPPAVESSLLAALDDLAAKVDVVLVADQLNQGCINSAIINRLEMISLSGKTVIVDSREKIGQYHNMIIKPNVLEGWRALNNNEVRPLPDRLPLSEYKDIANRLAKKNQASVCLTLGPEGCIWNGAGEEFYYPAYREEGTIDIVGAGDAFLAALGCALAADSTTREALQLASIVSNIVIHKIGATGSAVPDEIMRRHEVLSSLGDPFMPGFDQGSAQK